MIGQKHLASTTATAAQNGAAQTPGAAGLVVSVHMYVAFVLENHA
jgi:hypothetical protein